MKKNKQPERHVDLLAIRASARKDIKWYVRAILRALAMLEALVHGLAHALTKEWISSDLSSEIDRNNGGGGK